MPSPKDGSACSLVPPLSPDEAQAADVADPGEVDQVKLQQRTTGTGKYGSSQVAPVSEEEANSASEDPSPTSWVSFDLKDKNGNPIPNEPYSLKLPDGTIRTGSLDGDGKARVGNIQPGQCEISFPRIDKGEWRSA